MRTLLVLGALLALGTWTQGPLVQQLTPAWTHTTPWLDGDFRLAAVDVGEARGERSLQASFELARYMVVGSRVYDPAGGNRATATIPLGTVWATVCLFVAALVAWPLPGHSRGVAVQAAVARLLLGLALLAVLLGTLAPLEWLGHVREMVLSDAGHDAWSALHASAQFLAGGGRVLVPVLVASLCCFVADGWAAR